MSARRYAKAIVAILGAVATVALEQFAGTPVVDQWGPIVVALITALGVYLIPNLPGDPGPVESAE